MSFSAKLDNFSHDIRIKNGKILRIHGSDEVRQRIKVSLWHYFGEYFLDRSAGIPWYDTILGSKTNENVLTNLVRSHVQNVPGVIQVLTVSVTRIIRDYTISVTCVVQNGPGESPSQITISGISIGEN